MSDVLLIDDAITDLRVAIALARDGDMDDVLNVCERLLNLIEHLQRRVELTG